MSTNTLHSRGLPFLNNDITIFIPTPKEAKDARVERNTLVRSGAVKDQHQRIPYRHGRLPHHHQQQQQQQSSPTFIREGEYGDTIQLTQLIRSSLGTTFLPPSSSANDLLQGRAFLSSSGGSHQNQPRQIVDDPRKPYFVCKIFYKETLNARIDFVTASDALCALLGYSKVSTGRPLF